MMRDRESGGVVFAAVRTIVLSAAVLCAGRALAAPESAEDICSMAPQSRALIISITPLITINRPGTVIVVRKNTTDRVLVGAPCYLNGGDYVSVPAGAKAKLGFFDKQKPIELNPLENEVIPDFEPPGTVSEILRVMGSFFHTDTTQAWNQAHAEAAVSRDLRSLLAGGPIRMPGLVELGPQTIPAGETLSLHWQGGKPPFRVVLGNITRETTERSAQLDLSSMQLGSYELSVAGAGGQALAMAVDIVAPEKMPAAPGIGSVSDPEGRRLAQAVWMLTQAGPGWRVTALSGLYQLAAQGNLVAMSIVGEQGGGTR